MHMAGKLIRNGPVDINATLHVEVDRNTAKYGQVVERRLHQDIPPALFAMQDPCRTQNVCRGPLANSTAVAFPDIRPDEVCKSKLRVLSCSDQLSVTPSRQRHRGAESHSKSYKVPNREALISRHTHNSPPGEAANRVVPTSYDF